MQNILRGRKPAGVLCALVAAILLGCGGPPADAPLPDAGALDADAVDTGLLDGAPMDASSDAPSDADDADVPDADVPDAGADNGCAGSSVLVLDGVEVRPGDRCGACLDGVVVCAGTDAVECAPGPGPNACGGCGGIEGELGAPCTLEGGAPGTTICDGSSAMRCAPEGTNACGGTATLDGAPGAACGARGVTVCGERGETLVCATTIDERGGIVEIDGVRLEIPERALLWPVPLAIEAVAEIPGVDLDAMGVGAIRLALLPHGARFERPVTVRIAITDDVQPEATWVHQETPELASATDLDARVEDGHVVFELDHFSWVYSSWRTNCDPDGDGHVSRWSNGSYCVRFETGWVRYRRCLEWRACAPGGDCRPYDAAIHPGASERCNGDDDDCDAAYDEGLSRTQYYWDVDRDGYTRAEVYPYLNVCAPRPHDARYLTTTASSVPDCWDGRATVHPGAPELCNRLNDDCSIPPADPRDPSRPYLEDRTEDADYDGFSPPDAACTGGPLPKTDCDDRRRDVSPAATERCNAIDDECDGEIDELGALGGSVVYPDLDGDGYGAGTSTTACAASPGYVASSTDCDDGRADVSPAATEACNELDDDCDGARDEAGSSGESTFHRDADGDGFGDPAVTAMACTAAAGWVPDDTDCDDGRGTASPTATETCNGADDDCDGERDEPGAAGERTFFADADGDGYGDADVTVEACAAPAGFVDRALDCDDASGAVHPAATEVCNDRDDDCDAEIDEPGSAGAPTWYRDADEDGFGDPARALAACDQPAGHVADDTDCDDALAAVRPDAIEACNDRDDDCDAQIDEPGSTGERTFFRDEDGDRFGDAARTATACRAPAGHVEDDTDCDDARATTHPGATEACNGRDDDCDAEADEPGSTGERTFFGDADADGHGDPTATIARCAAPPGYVERSDDCDDADPQISPSAPERCATGADDDCDGAINEDGAEGAARRSPDLDGDGYGDPATTRDSCEQIAGWVELVVGQEDCDDTNVDVRPGALESCDDRDDDCDARVDEDPRDPLTFYLDGDGDGVGVAGATTQACDLPAGYARTSGDCDDARATVRPGAPERCDGVDEDCDGAIDDAPIDAPTFHLDADRDGHGDPLSSTTSSCTAPAGWVSSSDDCDDLRAAVHPGAPEICGGIDEDCDVRIDEDATDPLTFYRDADGDSFGDAGADVQACAAPPGYVSDDQDCDDAAVERNPGATERCDGIDADCDAVIDEGASDVRAYYRDADGDGHGDPGLVQTACSPPSGFVASPGDCDDARASAHPGASEACNGLDDDCDGAIDDGASGGVTVYLDADADGYGAGPAIGACSVEPGYATRAGDCDDASDRVSPGATERCDGVDEDCDGSLDDDPMDGLVYFRDADGDGEGSPDLDLAMRACLRPAGFSATSGDCDDDEPRVHEGEPELCDGLDNDCSGLADDEPSDGTRYYDDADGDTWGAGAGTIACAAPTGAVARGGDCDDGTASVHPGAAELCDGLDQDCDGTPDDSPASGTTYYGDADRDGYGVAATTVIACSAPDGYAALAGDCDETRSTVHPGAPERCDATDEDCDARVDEAAIDRLTWYRDADGDGATTTESALACTMPSGFRAQSLAVDCDDADAATAPGASETCDGEDDDCDGTVDEDPIDGAARFLDADADGFGAVPASACATAPGYADEGGDCADDDPARHPGVTETCNLVDDDCDARSDEEPSDGVLHYRDGDGDGYGATATTGLVCAGTPGWSTSGGDCDDASALRSPGAAETCNGVDDDCDGTIDDSASGGATYYRDADGDLFGDPAVTTTACARPAGHVELAGDCDDTRAIVYPSAAELCDGRDQDCDGLVDEGAAGTSWVYRDRDGDGAGDATTSAQLCGTPEGWVPSSDDCDDGDAAVRPGATETCNSADEDCDGWIDEGLPQITSYRDFDGDGVGATAGSTQACLVPLGYVETPGDCDDADALAHPGADERCDYADDDCDGAIDEAAVDRPTWYGDGDGDLYPDLDVTALACEAPFGYVAWDAEDCDDADFTVNPGASERCGGPDEDCDGRLDVGAVDVRRFRPDADGDGYGTTGADDETWACTAPSGWVEDTSDCDDADPTINTAAFEVCDYRDNQCDGFVDEGVSTTYYADADMDGYGSPWSTMPACSTPTGYVLDATDCDDWSAATSPAAPELPDNGRDDDCDGAIDEPW